ncbi:hypothetical protein AHAS_Ahas04G0172100 [Arachis hypogaea]
MNMECLVELDLINHGGLLMTTRCPEIHTDRWRSIPIVPVVVEVGLEVVTPNQQQYVTPRVLSEGGWINDIGHMPDPVPKPLKMTTKNQVGKKCNQTKDLKFATRLLSEKFEKISDPKKEIVRELGFGGLIHILPMNMPHKLLKELANSFKLVRNTLKASYGSFKVKPKKIGTAFGLNASGDLFLEKVSYKDLSKENKLIFRRFQGKTLKNLTDEMTSISVESEQDRLMFKRIFIIYIQIAFLLLSTITKVSPVHIAPIFEMKKITEGNWGAHVLNFIIKGITNYCLKKKKLIDGCLYALMIIYFYLAKNKNKKREEKPGVPWVSKWNREQLVARNRAEIDGHMGIIKMAETKKLKEMKEKEKKEEKKKKQKNKTKMESRKRKQILEDSSSKSKRESTDEMQSKKRKMPEVSLATVTDSLFQGQTEQSILIQLCMLPSSQTTSATPVLPFEPSPQQREPQKVDESTPTMPQAPSKIDPAPEATVAALLMMAQTASYVSREFSLSSFSLGLTDSSQEETQTQEGMGQPEAQVEKSPETTILIEELDVLVEKIAKSGEKTTPDFPEGKSLPTEKQTIVTAMCLILNQQNIKRLQEEIFCLPPNIVEISFGVSQMLQNMAIENHPDGEFL